MPRGPRGERRPEDPASAAVMVVQLATGEIAEETDESKTLHAVVASRVKDPAAVELGRRGGQRGGKARAAKLSSEERKAIAVRAAKARWGKGN